MALIAVLAVAASIIAFLFRNGIYVVVGIAGLMLAVAGGWWLVAERTVRRAVGALAIIVGVGVVAAALIGAGNNGEQILIRLLVVGGLVVLAVVSARAAMVGEVRRRAGQRFHRASPPARPVLLCNPWSGGGKVEKFHLVGLASGFGVQTVLLDHGLDLEQLARESVARGADCLGMAGGDGSQALVASIAVEHKLPFVCVSAGTRNHFALDLGLDRDDPRESVCAFRDAVERRVDYATVNGRLFVNNVSLGVYATIVQQDGYRDAKVDTTKTLLPMLLGRKEEPFDLQFTASDGTEVDGAFLVMISNNPYVLGPSLDLSQRRRLDSGRLGVFAVTATTGAEAARVVTLALAGRSARSGHAFEFTAEQFEVRSRSGKAYVGIDGEALEMETPLRFAIRPQGLRMLMPQGNIERSIRREARDVKIGDLLSLVRGSAPFVGSG